MSATTSAQFDAAADELASVELFFAAQLALRSMEPAARPEPPLADPELLKVRDLGDDVMRNATWLDADRLGHPTWLGRVFAGFEWLVGDVPRTLRAPLRDIGSDAQARGVGEQLPALCTQDFRLFDRLSQIHGGNFRGAVVFNALLAVIASATLLFSLSPPFAMEWMIERFHDQVTTVPLATVIEFVCIGWIGVIYARGRTPETEQRDDDDGADEDDDDEEEEDGEDAKPIAANDAEGSGDQHPLDLDMSWFAKRWHQRWLEYRLLAERFRYVELLLPLGEDAMADVSVARPEDAGRMWHERYFRARVKNTPVLSQTVAAYRVHALKVMAHQQAYHKYNHARRGAIAHFLHGTGTFVFFLALLICVVEFGLWMVDRASGIDAGSALSCVAPDERRATLLFFAALLPIFSAACYLIVTHAEFAKVADTSGETKERIVELRRRLKTTRIPLSDAPANPDTLAALRPVVVEFVAMAINEATGWRAMLRDKNVPLV